ncbi:MAG: PHP domain-containing protein [Candidatus Bathyarchaeia archaeon]
MRLDMHVHTQFSKDSNIDPRHIGRILAEAGMDGAAITDHGSLEGFKRAEGREGILLIPGLEVETEVGELLALFIEEPVDARDPWEAADLIRAQGGLVVLPHPFDRFRRSRLRPERFRPEDLRELVDAVEVLNSRCLMPSANLSAAKLASALGKPGTAGSDAHSAREVGRAYLTFERAEDPDELRKALLKGEAKPEGGLSGPLVHISSVMARMRNVLRR